MKQYNLNDEVIMYPNSSGWEKIIELTKKHYKSIEHFDVDNFVSSRRTEDNGFKEQLWTFMYIYHDMFFNGQSYWEHMNMGLAGKVEDDEQVSLLRDCVSETWMSKSFIDAQKNFDKFLKTRGISTV